MFYIQHFKKIISSMMMGCPSSLWNLLDSLSLFSLINCDDVEALRSIKTCDHPKHAQVCHAKSPENDDEGLEYSYTTYNLLFMMTSYTKDFNVSFSDEPDDWKRKLTIFSFCVGIFILSQLCSFRLEKRVHLSATHTGFCGVSTHSYCCCRDRELRRRKKRKKFNTFFFSPSSFKLRCVVVLCSTT